MNFNQFVLRNTMRNKGLYLAYFLSVLSTVMSFFTFSAFAYHPSLTADLHYSVKTGMLASAIIIYIFSFFFVWNSVDIFIQSRKKEFGLLLIQGMSPKQLKKMIVKENMIVGFFSTIFGIIVGIGFSQLLILLSNQLLGLDFSLYFPLKAIWVTLASFLVLFGFISFFVQFKVPKLDVQTLLKSSELGKGQLKLSKLKVTLAVLLIGIGYAIALIAKGPQVIFAMIPVIALVILGTNLLFSQFSVFAVNRLQKNKKWFWKKTNLLVFSDLNFRMKDNAKAFFLVTVISTVAFSAIGTLVGFKEMIFKGIDATPYDISLYVSDDKPEETKKSVALIEEAIQKNKINAEAIELAYFTHLVRPDQDRSVSLVKESDYNRVAKRVDESTVKVGEKPVLVETSLDKSQMDSMNEKQVKSIQLSDKKDHELETERVKYNLLGSGLPLVIVKDQEYDTLQKADKAPISKTYQWSVAKGQEAALVKLGEELQENHDIQVKEFGREMINRQFGPILFVGFFIGLVFFISAGSFLYFRLYSDMPLDKEKFLTVYKLGFSKKEMKKVVYQQIGILFFTPMVVSVCHGLVALTAMYALFAQPLQIMAPIVLGIFLLIQAIYYLIARTFYFKKLYKEITKIA